MIENALHPGYEMGYCLAVWMGAKRKKAADWQPLEVNFLFLNFRQKKPARAKTRGGGSRGTY
ncbi:hypothetical protein [Dryocola clanedunensis]|uniref:hypothetical protein n=1 Tax=Cedecea sulfonylureivorans TaxID=3051154 RepID=UPI001928D7BA|nr:hypothetical protein [Cedecea sulfonylureivorans]